MNMKLEEEKRKKRFMEARGGSVGEGYVKVNGEWVKEKDVKVVWRNSNSNFIVRLDVYRGVNYVFIISIGVYYERSNWKSPRGYERRL